MTQNKLWTYDFTVITIGSFISMVGSTLASFSISLVVLDYTGSTFLYMLFHVCYQLPMVVMPLLAGPYLDRMSRKKMIYTLDYASAGIFALMYLLLQSGWMNYALLLGGSVALGAINGVYTVAYDSFYPNLISPGNAQRAYSVSSMLWPIAAMTTPVAAAIYDLLGSAGPVFAANAACFFAAACFERRIRHQETHMDHAPPADGLGTLRRFRRDFREGMTYIRGERGLLMIALYFSVISFCGGADSLRLPYFRANAGLYAAWPVAAVTLYAIVSNFDVVGRLIGGAIQYRVRIPARRKFAIALAVYAATNLLGAGMLYLPIPLMAAACFVNGILGVTSYTIRTAATQAYVPDKVRARFNGTFQMLNSLGGIAGGLAAGALAEFFPEREIILAAFLGALGTVYLFIYRGREDVKRIYNRDMA